MISFFRLSTSLPFASATACSKLLNRLISSGLAPSLDLISCSLIPTLSFNLLISFFNLPISSLIFVFSCAGDFLIAFLSCSSIFCKSSLSSLTFVSILPICLLITPSCSLMDILLWVSFKTSFCFVFSVCNKSFNWLYLVSASLVSCCSLLAASSLTSTLLPVSTFLGTNCLLFLLASKYFLISSEESFAKGIFKVLAISCKVLYSSENFCETPFSSRFACFSLN